MYALLQVVRIQILRSKLELRSALNIIGGRIIDALIVHLAEFAVHEWVVLKMERTLRTQTLADLLQVVVLRLRGVLHVFG